MKTKCVLKCYGIILVLLLCLACFHVEYRGEERKVSCSVKEYRLISIRIVKQHRFISNRKELKVIEIEFLTDKFISEEFSIPVNKAMFKANTPCDGRNVLDGRFGNYMMKKLKDLKPLSLDSNYTTRIPGRRFGTGTVEITYTISGEDKIEKKTIVVDRFPEGIFEQDFDENRELLDKCSDDIRRIYELNILAEGAEHWMIYKAGLPPKGRADWWTYMPEYEFLEQTFRCKDNKDIILEKLKEIIEKNPAPEIRKDAQKSLELLTNKEW